MGEGIRNGGLGTDLDAEGLRPMSGVASSREALPGEEGGTRVRRRNRREQGEAEDRTAEEQATEESDEQERHQIDRIA